MIALVTSLLSGVWLRVAAVGAGLLGMVGLGLAIRRDGVTAQQATDLKAEAHNDQVAARTATDVAALSSSAAVDELHQRYDRKS